VFWFLASDCTPPYNLSSICEVEVVLVAWRSISARLGERHVCVAWPGPSPSDSDVVGLAELNCHVLNCLEIVPHTSLEAGAEVLHMGAIWDALRDLVEPRSSKELFRVRIASEILRIS
jgi:hypothetical protein